MIYSSAFARRKTATILSVLMIVAVSAVVLAQTSQTNPHNKATPAGTGQVGTFDVQMINFTPWNTETDSSGIFLDKFEDYSGVIGFQVLDDKILYLDDYHGIVDVDRKSGKKVKNLYFFPFVNNFVFEDGKYYINSSEHSIDVYDVTGKLLNVFPYPRKLFSDQMVRYNGSTYVIFHKEDANYQFLGKASFPIDDNGKIGTTVEGVVDQSGNILVDIHQTDQLGYSRINTASSFIKTATGKTFIKNLANLLNQGDIIGLSSNRIFVRRVEYPSEGVERIFLQSYAFDKKKGIGDKLAEIEIPFISTPFYANIPTGEFSVSPDGMIYKVIANEKGVFMFSLKEAKYNEPHTGFPSILEIPK